MVVLNFLDKSVKSPHNFFVWPVTTPEDKSARTLGHENVGV
jgi:hypothetical protein